MFPVIPHTHVLVFWSNENNEYFFSWKKFEFG